MAYKIIRFGLGEIISDRAMAGEFPAVTLEPSTEAPGEVGTKGPDLPLTELRDGSVVLEFHGIEGAKVLIEDIVVSLSNNGHDLSAFLRALSKTDDEAHAELYTNSQPEKCGKTNRNAGYASCVKSAGHLGRHEDSCGCWWN